jgi:hypothetical protein
MDESQSDLWAFGTPEWDEIKKDVKTLSNVLNSTMYRFEYVNRVCRQANELNGEVRKLHKQIEMLVKENEELKRASK